MKKLFFIFIFVLCFSTLWAEGLYIKAGLDIPSKLTLESVVKDGDDRTEINQIIHSMLSFHFSLEYTKAFFNYPVVKDLDLGVGLRYEGEPREQETLDALGFSTIPLYGIATYNVFTFEKFNIYLSGKIGYSFEFTADDNYQDFEESKGGLFWGIAFGVEQVGGTNFIWEVMYSESRASFRMDSGDHVIEQNFVYPKFSITIGIQFDLFTRRSAEKRKEKKMKLEKERFIFSSDVTLDKNTKIYLDFSNAELSRITKWFSSKTGVNYILSGKTGKTKFTIKIDQKLTYIKAQKQFLEELKRRCFTIKENGSYIIIAEKREEMCND